MATDYFDQTKDKYLDKLQRTLKKLPACAQAFLNAKAAAYEVSTRVRYADDLMIYCSYLHDAVDAARSYEIKDIPTSVIAGISPEQIDSYMAYLVRYELDGVEYHNNNAALKRKLASLRSFYKFLFARGLAKSNPASLVDSPKLNKKDILAMDSKEQSSILSSVTTGEHLSEKQNKRREKVSLRDTAIIYILIGTGLRISELVGLDTDDIDFDNRRLYVIRKGGNKDHVYFNDEIAAVLMDYLYNERPGLKPGERDEKALFISQKHSRISVRHVDRLIEKYAEGTGIRDSLSAHSFRRTFATKALEEGFDLSSIAAAMGHKQTSTTSKYYTKVSEEAKKRVSQMKINKKQR